MYIQIWNFLKYFEAINEKIVAGNLWNSWWVLEEQLNMYEYPGRANEYLDMTGFRWFTKIFASLRFWRK